MIINTWIVIWIIPRIRALSLISSRLSWVIESLLSMLGSFINLPLLIFNDLIEPCNLFLQFFDQCFKITNFCRLIKISLSRSRSSMEGFTVILHLYYIIIIFSLRLVRFLFNLKQLLLLKSILAETIAWSIHSWSILLKIRLRLSIFNLMWYHVKLGGLRNLKIINRSYLHFFKWLEVGSHPATSRSTAHLFPAPDFILLSLRLRPHHNLKTTLYIRIEPAVLFTEFNRLHSFEYIFHYEWFKVKVDLPINSLIFL